MREDPPIAQAISTSGLRKKDIRRIYSSSSLILFFLFPEKASYYFFSSSNSDEYRKNSICPIAFVT